MLLKASFQYRFPSLCVFLLSKEASKSLQETFALEWCLLQPVLHSTGRAGEGVWDRQSRLCSELRLRWLGRSLGVHYSETI